MSARKSSEQSYDPAAEGTGFRTGAYRFARTVMTAIVNMTMTRTWSGMDNIPKAGPVLLAVNHLGHADPAAVALFIDQAGRHPRFLAKAELQRIRGLGYLMDATGQIAVYRETREAGLALVNAVKRLEAGGCVVVYPEGTITKDPDLWPMVARTGIARLYLATGAPVVPVSHWGTHTLRKRWRPWRRLEAKIEAGPALDLERFHGKPPTPALLNEITDVVVAALRAGVAKLRDEPAPPVIWDNRKKKYIAFGDSRVAADEAQAEPGDRRSPRARRKTA